MAIPIWKDYYVSLGSADSIEYRILCNDAVIYTGKSFKRPGESANQIRINDICADYLEVSDSAFPTFKVQVYSQNAWTQKGQTQFYNDWSYDGFFDPTDGLSKPIIKKFDRRQWIVFSEHNATSIKVIFYYIDGSYEQMDIPVEIPEDLTTGTDFVKDLAPVRSGTAFFRLPEDDIASFSINGERFEVVDSCCRYALYYENAHGGWDSLLIEGNHLVKENLTRHTRSQEYNNTNVSNRGARNFANEIVKTMTLHTSWISDKGSQRMHHLLNSCKVYLYDMEMDIIIPVVLTGTSNQYKTYKSNGCQLVNYAIEVSFADSRVRR